MTGVLKWMTKGAARRTFNSRKKSSTEGHVRCSEDEREYNEEVHVPQ